MLRVLAYNEQYLPTWSSDFWKGRTIKAPACSVSAKGPGLSFETTFDVSNKPAWHLRLRNPSQVLFQNMCHFYGFFTLHHVLSAKFCDGLQINYPYQWISALTSGKCISIYMQVPFYMCNLQNITYKKVLSTTHISPSKGFKLEFPSIILRY